MVIQANEKLLMASAVTLFTAIEFMNVTLANLTRLLPA
jgi:hypothetical protein